MAQQPQPQYDFHYQNVELIKTESLGIGSYGAVYKALCDDLPCAAKILHPALFQFTAPGTTSVMRKFEQECHLLSAIKHPHIVQYLGTYRDPESIKVASTPNGVNGREFDTISGANSRATPLPH